MSGKQRRSGFSDVLFPKAPLFSLWVHCRNLFACVHVCAAATPRLLLTEGQPCAVRRCNSHPRIGGGERGSEKKGSSSRSSASKFKPSCGGPRTSGGPQGHPGVVPTCTLCSTLNESHPFGKGCKTSVRRRVGYGCDSFWLFNLKLK